MLVLIIIAAAGVVAFGLNAPDRGGAGSSLQVARGSGADAKTTGKDASRSHSSTVREEGARANPPAKTSGTRLKKTGEKVGTNKQGASKRSGKNHSQHTDRKEARTPRRSACGPTPPKPPNDALYLTVPKLGIYGDTVTNSNSAAALNQGAIKLPPTGFPWQPCANTYIIGHRLGYAGTQSYYQFYNLPSMQPGDEIILTDSNGTRYIYRVTRVFAVGPYDTRYTYPVSGKNLVTLQTCITSLNDWWSIGPEMYNDSPNLDRLLVQGERVAIEPGSS